MVVEREEIMSFQKLHKWVKLYELGTITLNELKDRFNEVRSKEGFKPLDIDMTTFENSLNRKIILA
jgi:ArsR family metal-binding transcriptional regulator